MNERPNLIPKTDTLPKPPPMDRSLFPGKEVVVVAMPEHTNRDRSEEIRSTLRVDDLIEIKGSFELKPPSGLLGRVMVSSHEMEMHRLRWVNSLPNNIN